MRTADGHLVFQLAFCLLSIRPGLGHAWVHLAWAVLWEQGSESGRGHWPQPYSLLLLLKYRRGDGYGARPGRGGVVTCPRDLSDYWSLSADSGLCGTFPPSCNVPRP